MPARKLPTPSPAVRRMPPGSAMGRGGRRGAQPGLRPRPDCRLPLQKGLPTGCPPRPGCPHLPPPPVPAPAAPAPPVPSGYLSRLPQALIVPLLFCDLLPGRTSVDVRRVPTAASRPSNTLRETLTHPKCWTTCLSLTWRHRCSTLSRSCTGADTPASGEEPVCLPTVLGSSILSHRGVAVELLP